VTVGGTVFDEKVLAKLISGDTDIFDQEKHILSSRELEVLRLIKDGKTNKEMADLLNLAYATVKKYVQTLFVKLGANNRTEAVVIAAKWDLELDSQDSDE